MPQPTSNLYFSNSTVVCAKEGTVIPIKNIIIIKLKIAIFMDITIK